MEQIKWRNDFSRVADAYAKYRRDYPEKAYELIYSFCPDKNSRILDIGCGTGLVTHHLARYYDTVIGVDRSAEMLEAARESDQSNTSFLVASAEDLPFEDQTLGLITVAAAYHWFDYDKAGKEICRVLKKDGKLCVFWKYTAEHSGNLPNFAIKNLKKFIPEIPRPNTEEMTEDIFLRVGFTSVDYKQFDFDEMYSKEEILGYIQSHSTFNLLDEAQKEEYKKLNELSVDEHLTDGTFIFKSRMEMWFIEK